MGAATLGRQGRQPDAILNPLHISVVSEGELAPEATVRKLRIVRREGRREVTCLIDHHSPDGILAVGYRVRSARGTQFRQAGRLSSASSTWGFAARSRRLIEQQR